MKKTCLILLVALLAFGPGCSIRRLAVNKVGDALSGGAGVMASDDDPELVKAAVPFSLKLMEALLAESPRHSGLLLAAASGFTQYSYAFVQQDSDELEDKDLAAALEMKGRARRLFLRARNYGLRGLEVGHKGFETALRSNPRAGAGLARKTDVPLLYWTAAAWASAISLSKDNPDLVADLPLVEAMIDRALELNEAFDDGAIHSFLITYEMTRPGVPGDPAERAKKHFDRAMELSHGQDAGPLVSFAEAVCVQKQDLKGFQDCLRQALAIDVNQHPANRLVNLVMQRRAKWLLSRTDQLFLIPETKPRKEGQDAT
jgi:predicted anti-sigma-YlaC factor YlaD